MIATCRGCPRRWTSTTECHCGTCHRHFRNLSGFDAHRREGRCLDPADVGLVEIDGVWATPEGHEAAQRSRERLESVRPRGRSRYPHCEGFYFSHPQEHGQLRGDR